MGGGYQWLSIVSVNADVECRGCRSGLGLPAVSTVSVKASRGAGISGFGLRWLSSCCDG